MDTSDEIYTDIKHILDNDEYINMSNLTSIVLQVMQLVEKLPSDGPTKKKVATEVIMKLISNSNNSNKDQFMEIAKVTVPPMIDCLVDLDRGKIAIKIAEKSRSCMECICM